GHADFGGEVERGLTMVDGVLLLVDASEGPLPQTRFVLRKALQAHLPVILVVNKVDRPDARIGEVVDEVYELFLDLDADESQIEFPIVYTNARDGRAGLEPDALAADLSPLFDLLLERIPAPEYDPEHPLQALVTNLDSSPYVGRLALLRVRHGTLRKGSQVAWCRADGTIENARVAELYVTEALDRVPADEAGPGGVVALAGVPAGAIGETNARSPDPPPPPPAPVRQPRLVRTLGVRTPPPLGHRRPQADRERPDRPARAGAGRQRLATRPADRAARCVGGAGPRRAAARCAGRDHAPRGLRADRRQARGADARGRRDEARAGRARGDRRGRGLHGRRHTTARAAEGRAAADGQPRHRLGANGVSGAGPRPDWLPHGVPDRDARDGNDAPRFRPLGALARRVANPADRVSCGGSPRAGDRIRDRGPPGARLAIRRPARRAL